MSAPAPPSVPPRPVKQQAAAQGVSTLPDMPSRPLSKRVERSVSPSGSYPRSPLNDPYLPAKSTAINAPLKPPSVSHLPIPGEEGMEYANVQYIPFQPSSALAQDAAAQTRTIAEDLHLHAPKPSLPNASAQAQVQPVTRTDSAHAASHGVGRASNDDLIMTRTRSRQSFSRPDSAASGDRRRSIYADEHGPAELGMRVPINPLLGDVQAPTPVGLSPQPTGESPRPHGRKKSTADNFRPPDSYGLHGHGVIANTKFERDWYSKHPDQLEHEEGQGHGVYEGIGSGRGIYALSSDELNKIVRTTASRGSGSTTKEHIVSIPDEQIGYQASEEYQRSSQNTPHPENLSRIQTHASQPAVESPLRRTSFPAEDAVLAEIRRSRVAGSQASDNEHDDVHHIAEPARRFNKITGGQESINETQDPTAHVTRYDEDGNESHVPILAEDDGAKHTEFLHSAISPKFERRGSLGHDDHGSGAHTPTSRPASRPGSIYQLHSASHSLSRFLSHQDERDHLHTPLEDVAEYEPLFDETEEAKAMTTAERFKKRPGSLQKRFPSQDIWEDTPNSAMYEAEVSTPDLPAQADSHQLEKSELRATSTFEPPEVESARKGEVPESEKHNLAPKEERYAKSKFAPHLRDDMPTKSRPTLINRFPSRDIWEDSPDSSYLVTTVGSPQLEEESSPIESKPPVPARPVAKGLVGEGASSAQVEPGLAPQIPARPAKRNYQVPPADAQLTDPVTFSRDPASTEVKKVPSIPDRPKPQIPPRPAKKSADDELTKVPSAGSIDSNEAERAIRSKPQVPARPSGGNLAGLKGNFISDLNKKLGLGPPKEKEPEPEVEAKPLEDARKGRARGPQRRAPAKSPVGDAKSRPQFAIFAPIRLWHIDDQDELTTIHEVKEEQEGVSTIDHASEPTSISKADEEVVQRPSDTPLKSTSGFARNTASESIDPSPVGEDENLEGELTRKTTASDSSGQQLDREDSLPATHVLPASQQTTASDSDAAKVKLEKVPSHETEVEAKDEPIKVNTAS